MDITTVIDEQRINLHLDANNKAEVLDAMGDMLLKAGVLSSKEDVYFRESEGTTGIGGGIAIPHGKSSSVLKTSLAIARTLKPIEWETLDDKPVQFIILFAVRDVDKTTVHVRLLGEVAGKLADEDITKKSEMDHVFDRLTTNEPAEIIAIFNED